jgi:hypothetical protein
LVRSFRLGAASCECAELPRTELAFADHSLVPVNLMFNSVIRGVALAEQKANDFKAAFSRMLDTPLWEKFYCLAESIFVL